MKEEYKKRIERAKSNRKSYKKLIKGLKGQKNLDGRFQELHNDAFEVTDCLKCANCCKTTSPIFTDRDIDRLAYREKMKPSRFIEKYLHLDSENHYVLNSVPCPFLGEDNYCRVYGDRPKACREYPHTNRKRVHQAFDLTLKNAEICPAVASMLEKLHTAAE